MALKIENKPNEVLGINIETGIESINDINRILKRESSYLPTFGANHLAVVTGPITTAPVGTAQRWMSEPTTMPNIATYSAISTKDYNPPAGSAFVITKITFYGSLDFTAQAYIRREMRNPIVGSNATVAPGLVYGSVKVQGSQAGGSVDVISEPIVLMPGDFLNLYYYRGKTTAADIAISDPNLTSGMRWFYNVEGYALTSDFNFNAKHTILQIGDSLSVTSDPNSLTSGKNSDGTYFGLYPFIISQRFKEQGKDVRLVNISQAGTKAVEWDWMIKQGRIDGIKADILLISFFANDQSSDAALPFVEQILRNVAGRFLQNNPNSAIVMNQLAQAGTFNQTRAVNYRNAISLAVADMRDDGINIHLAATDLAFSYTQSAPYVAAEAAVEANRLHWNTTVGHPAIAEKVWEKAENLIP